MGRVTIETSDIAAGVRGFGEMRLLVRFAVAGQTANASLLPRLSLEHEYLGLVATPRHVVGSGTVATFATLLRRTALRVQCGLPVRRFRPSVISFLVTRLAGLCTHILGHIGGRRIGHGCGGGLKTLTCCRWTSLACCKCDSEKKEDRQKNSKSRPIRLDWQARATPVLSHDG